MEENMKCKLKIACGISLLLLIGCQEPEGGGSPFEARSSIPYKRLQTNSALVEFVCYVDVEKYNPLNAKDYVFTASGAADTQFFNYVVLGYSYLTKTESGYVQLELTPSLKYVLDNSTTYIKPLHQKGIQVLIEVRSGNFSDTQDGIGVGLGTLDMAAINELTKAFKLLVDHYGIDGFDFNDVGGGRKAYPPLTRNLTQFRSDTPLYPDELFTQDGKRDGPPLSDAEIEAKLWIEGGSNFSNLVQRTNEELKETYTSIFKNGSSEEEVPQTVERAFLVRNKNHGAHLLLQLRMAYMPDAYSGAIPRTMGNLKYIVNDTPYDNNNPHAPLWDETQKKDVGENSDDQYAPFTVDLADQKDTTTAQTWAKTFTLKDPTGSSTNSSNQNRYGALYFTNLPPVSESASAAYMTYFSREFFGRIVRLADTPHAGDYKKTW
jgi:hypothetical protein